MEAERPSAGYHPTPASQSATGSTVVVAVTSGALVVTATLIVPFGRAGSRDGQHHRRHPGRRHPRLPGHLKAHRRPRPPRPRPPPRPPGPLKAPRRPRPPRPSHPTGAVTGIHHPHWAERREQRPAAAER